MIKEWKWVKSEMDERMGLLRQATQQTGSVRHTDSLTEKLGRQSF